MATLFSLLQTLNRRRRQPYGRFSASSGLHFTSLSDRPLDTMCIAIRSGGINRKLGELS